MVIGWVFCCLVCLGCCVCGFIGSCCRGCCVVLVCVGILVLVCLVWRSC